MNRKTRIVTLLTLFVLALFILVPAASAFDGRSGDTVVIGKDEVINDDLFVGGNTVTVDGTVNGDLRRDGPNRDRQRQGHRQRHLGRRQRHREW